MLRLSRDRLQFVIAVGARTVAEVRASMRLIVVTDKNVFVDQPAPNIWNPLKREIFRQSLSSVEKVVVDITYFERGERNQLVEITLHRDGKEEVSFA